MFFTKKIAETLNEKVLRLPGYQENGLTKV